MKTLPAPSKAPAPALEIGALNWNGLIPVQQVLDHIRPAYGDTWGGASAMLLGDPAERAVIDHLIAALNGSGRNRFEQPVVLDLDERIVCNGMHRIIATLLTGAEHILAATDYPTRHTSPTDITFVEVHFRLAERPPVDWKSDSAEKARWQAAFDHAHGWLRSFPLPDGTWVETDFFAASGGTLEGLWCCPHEHATALTAAMEARIPGLTIDTVRCCTQADLDAEYDKPTEDGPLPC